MAKTKITVRLDSDLLQRLDALVAECRFPNRSQAIETAVAEQLERTQHDRLAHECAKLDPDEDKALAEEDMT